MYISVYVFASWMRILRGRLAYNKMVMFRVWVSLDLMVAWMEVMSLLTTY